MTSVFQLVALITVYQSYSASKRSRNIGILAAVLFIVIIAYMVLFSVLTIYVPQAKRSIVIGYKCAPSAKAVFANKCPFLDLEDLAGVALIGKFLVYQMNRNVRKRVAN